MKIYRRLRLLSKVVLVSLLLVGCSGREVIPDGLYQRANLLVDQGTSLLQRGSFNQAEAAFSLAQELVPLAAAVDGLGCIALLKGELEKAKVLFSEAYSMDRDYDEAAAHLALLADLQGDAVRSRELYTWYLARHPEDPFARNNFAAFDLDTGGDRELNLKQLRRAAALLPKGAVLENIEELTGS